MEKDKFFYCKIILYIVAMVLLTYAFIMCGKYEQYKNSDSVISNESKEEKENQEKIESQPINNIEGNELDSNNMQSDKVMENKTNDATENTVQKQEQQSTVTNTPTENVLTYPIIYSDNTCTLTITKEWYKSTWCYAAHLQLTDYTRLKTACAYKNGYETTSNAANRLGAIFAVNGDHAERSEGCAIARDGVVIIDKACDSMGIYNANTGVFSIPEATGMIGTQLSTLVANKKVTDTFCFVKPYLINGKVVNNFGNSRAQRTFIGTNSNPGDIWIVVSDGRMNDGKSSGLTYHECAEFLKTKGCINGIPLDGGGSSTMVFKGQVLNAAKKGQRAVIDFLYLK